MMKINNLSFSYGNKTIFKNTKFESVLSGITVIYGKSGIGKSTLLNILMGELECDSYDFSEYKNGIGYIRQNPSFIYDLKLSSHIELYESTYGLKHNQEDLQFFDLRKSLNNFPNSLSGGEKLRWGILLESLKGKKYLLCDEPTASLDWIQKRKVIEFLVNYAKKGRHVIVCTHDKSFIEYAAKVYEIKDYQLCVVKENCQHFNQNSNGEVKETHKGNLYKVLRQNISYHWQWEMAKKFVLAFTILLSVIAFKFDDQLLTLNLSQEVEPLSQEIIVYNRIGGKLNQTLSYLGHEQQLKETELQYIENLDYVTKVTPMYHAEYRSYWLEPTIGHYGDISTSPLSLIKSEDEIIIFTSEETNTYLEGSVAFNSYLVGYEPQDVNNEDVSVFYNNNLEGIYINQNLAKVIQERVGISDFEDCSLKIRVVIPMYQTNASSTTLYTSDMNEQAYGLFLNNYENVGQEIYLTLPISGVIKETKLGLIDIEQSIFIPNIMLIPNNFVINEAKNAIKDEQIYTYQIFNEYGIPESFLEEELTEQQIDESVSITTYTPYRANSYRAFIEDMNRVDEVVGYLEAAGFGVYYGETTTSQNPFFTYVYKQSFDILYFSFNIICLVAVCVTQIADKEKRIEMKQSLMNLMPVKLDKKLNEMINLRYLIQAVRLTILSAVLVITTFLYFKTTTYLYFSLKDLFIPIIIIVMASIYEVVLPKVIGGVIDD